MPLIKILIVEDEAIIAEDIASKLKRMGYEVVNTVASGEEAIALAIETKPDLILMDIVLQGEIDGIEATQKIHDHLDIPVIYLTAYADQVTLERAKVTQPFGYLLKPFQAEELHTTIEISLSRHALEKEIHPQNFEQLKSNSTEKQNIETFQAEYLSLVVHEFRNPLTHILGWTQLLRNCRHNKKCSPDSIDKAFNYIEKAAKTINLLLEDVLTMARTESPAIQFQPTPLDLADFCQDLIKTLELNSQNKYVFQFQYQGNSHFAVDKNLLWHMLTNLLSNAVKYSPDGSKIIFNVQVTDTETSFEIQDSGIGIPPEDLNHLFEPFSRGSNCGNIPGTGLGLAIVKRCVDIHHGHIEVKSTVNVGTTFKIILPKNS
jgi:hypothetical protein